MLPVNSKLPLNSKVRFTQERLAILTPRDRKSLEGRIGVVQLYLSGSKKPTVYFPEDGQRVEIRLLQMDPRHLELVEAPPEPAVEEAERHEEPAIEDQSALSDDTDKDKKLSQSELDNLFG